MLIEAVNLVRGYPKAHEHDRPDAFRGCSCAGYVGGAQGDVWGGPAGRVCLAGRVRRLWLVWPAGRVVRLAYLAVVQGLLEPAEPETNS